MILKIFRSIILIFLFIISNLKAEDIISDSDYYEKGVELYKSANFSDAFIIFFNLAIKDNTDAQFNLTNMYANGIGTTKDYKEALKWSWLCALGGEKKCIKRIQNIKSKIDEKTLEKISSEVQKLLTDELYKNKNINYALKLGFWYEKFSPIIDIEKAYVWYSVSVTGGLYKAMKIRDKVEEEIETEKIIELQAEATKIYTTVKYFVN